MILNEALVFLVVSLKWNSILLMNANEEVSTPVVTALNSKGVSISAVGVNEMEDYLWPERYNIRPPFNGHLLILDKFRSSLQHISRIVQFLKTKNIFHTQHPWIIGVDGYFCLPRTLKLFDENDQVIFVGKYLTSDYNCSRMGRNNRHNVNISTCSHKTVFSVWVLRSSGNGSVSFENKGYLGCNISSESIQTFYEKPFKNFRGRTIKISSLGSPPIGIPPRKGEKVWQGYMFKIINTLAEIFNFSYVVKEADNRLYGMKQKDGTWTGMIGELTRKSVDIGVGDLSWTMERSMAVDFTLPVFPETNTFIYRAPAFYSRTWILFEDIDYMIWISLAASFIVVWTTFFLTLSTSVLRKSSKKKSNKNQENKKYMANVFQSIGILYRGLLGQGIPRAPRSMSSRVIFGTWVIGSFVLSALYSGGLTSKLSLHKSPRPANTLRELLRRYPNALLAVRNNSQIHSFFKEAPYWRDVWLLNMKNNVIPGKITIHDTMKRVHDKKASPPYVWIAERSMLVKMMYRYSDDPHVCDLYVALEAIERADWSLALVRNSPFLTQFDEMIKRMQRFGLLEKWRRENWSSGRGTCNPSDGLNRSLRSAMSFNDTQAIFIVLALSWIVGVAILLMERRLHFKVKRSTV